MSAQPVALRLADGLDAHAKEVEQSNGRIVFVALTLQEVSRTTAELRRLAEVEYDWMAHREDLERLIDELIDENELLKAQRDALLEALKYAEAGLADIGDADREPGDDLAWCEARAAEALPRIRAAIAAAEGT